MLPWVFSFLGRTNMVGRKRSGIPKALAHGRDRFEAWRRSRKLGARIPNRLWSLAVRLAEARGVSRTASALNLDNHTLKNRVTGKNCDSSLVAPTFIGTLGTHHDSIGHSKNRGFGKRLQVTSVNRGSTRKTRGALSAHGDAAISPPRS